MSDVGDAIEITFNAPTGATVTLSWGLAGATPEFTGQPVAENPPGSGQYPATVVGTAAGIWTAVFAASGTVTAVESYHQTFSDPVGPPPLASISDYTDLFGPLPVARQSVAKELLRRASALVRDRYPAVDDRIAAGTLPANSVALAVLNMTARVLRNPEGLRAQTVGPVSRSFDPVAASGLLTFSDTDAALLLPTATTAASGKVRVGSIRLTPGLAPTPRHWRWGR